MQLQQNTDRIQTTHIGSLPRPRRLLDALKAKYSGEAWDEKAFQQALREEVANVVREQVQCGIDIVTDGEFSKPGFFTYIRERLEGFETRPGLKLKLFRAGGRGVSGILRGVFQARDERRRHRFDAAGRVRRPCQISRRQAFADRHRQRESRACGGGGREQHVFLPATAPSGVGLNEYYKSDEEYFHALARRWARNTAPSSMPAFSCRSTIPSCRTFSFEPGSTGQKKRRAEIYVEAVNAALKGIPSEQVRFHTCYGINDGPGSTKRRSTTSSSMYSRSMPAPISFEAPIRATNTSITYSSALRFRREE